jgi:protease secretion system membrane fusion protein
MQVIDVKSKEIKVADPSTGLSGAKEALDAQLKMDKSLPTDAKRPLRIGLIVLLLGFGGFLLWATFVPLASGIPSSGTVVVDGRRKAVQHLSGGVVKQILVREGQSVNEGTVLMRMDDSIALANKSNAESQLKSIEIQIKFLEKLTTDLQAMAEEGFYPKNRFIELQKQLADAQGQRAALKDRLEAARLELQRALVISPAKGRVMGLAITTEGGVVPPGSKLLEVVPDDERLVVEAQIMPHLIDRVIPGLTAEVRFSHTMARKTPMIVGAVEWVSADRFQNPQDPTGMSGYYTARVIVSAEELKKLPDVQVRPGMIADVIVQTGHRTFMNYLFKPLTDSMAVSLKEH